jgi:hypothetical protein
VDATVQDRGPPVGRYEDAQKYFSGKHHIYCLKSQVVTNREGLAVHVVAGVPGVQHDLRLFRDYVREIEDLVAMHEGESCHILAARAISARATPTRWCW